MSSSGTRLSRRTFLQGGVAATLGLGLGAGRSLGDEDPPRVRRRVTLGRTGLEISDISFGSGTTEDPEIVRYAFERGINYFDTAESYPLGRGGGAERAIGRALRGVRDEVVITSKTQAGPRARRGQLMRRLEGTLRRLGTDRVEIYLNHAVNDLERLRNPEWFEFVAQAKRQGKIRFSGISGHGGRLIECLDASLDEDLVDVVLVAHNFGQDPAFYERFTRSFDLVANQEGLPRLMKKAHAKGVGVLAMKTLMGAKLNDMRPYEKGGATFAQAAFRWVLSNPDVDGLVVTMKSREQVDEYLGASGQGTVRPADARLLEGYLARNAAEYCRHGCGSCASSCPNGVEIAEVLRTRMYATHYRDLDSARESYAAIAGDATACLGCAEPSCRQACHYDLDVAALTRSTPAILGRA